MKAKTIEKTISKKMIEWIESINDESLRKQLHKEVIVTGGCITSMFLQEPVNDYDVYLKTPQAALALAEYYCNILREKTGYKIYVKKRSECGSIIEHTVSDNVDWRASIYIPSSGMVSPDSQDSDYIEDDETKPKYTPVFASENAITLTGKVQIVIRFTGSPDKIHENYDFTHATNWWTFKEGLVTNTKALECILAKELVYQGSKYPLASIFRTRKFIQRGWSCHVGNYLKMALQLNDYDLQDIWVLREQLTGVDALYLNDVIEACILEGERNGCVSSTYVCKVVDRLMGIRDED